ncbi:MAG TPA: cation:proton antiporter [Candidatus Binataceae bacterium]|nr:cation:proton antiporter [Candidatus Binataceae bacterium]
MAIRKASVPSERAANRLTREILIYALLLGGAVLLYMLIRAYGDALPAPARAPAQLGVAAGPASGHDADVMLHILLALSVVIAVARVGGMGFRLLGQPAVVGEIVAGIMLGPSLLGSVWPAAFNYLMPPMVAPFLDVLAQLGIILYMFLVGLEFDSELVSRNGQAAVAISHASIVTPFLLGTMLALLLYPHVAAEGVPFTGFSLFMGVSMSVTAFPVLSRILTDLGIHKTPLGITALTCAAVDDVTAWCLLALVVGVVEAHGTGSLITAAMSVAYILFMILLVRPSVTRLTLRQERTGPLTQGVIAVVFVLLLLSALCTEMIGIHAMFGAFALGAVIPSDSRLAHQMTERLEDVLVVLLLPIFFAFTGLRTRIGLVSGLHAWMLCALVIAVASIGKFGGSFVAARLTGLGWRDASALGILMNTRGLAELIVLNIGLQLRVINPTVFAMLVVMSLVTTLTTTPILHLVMNGEVAAARSERGMSRMAWLRRELLRHVDLRRRSLGQSA